MSKKNISFRKFLKIGFVGVLCAVMLFGYSLEADAVQHMIRFNQAQVNVLKGEKRRLHFSCSRKYTLFSTDKSVATVSQKGIVKGKKSGKCWIICRCGGQEARIRVRVMRSIKSKHMMFIGHRGYQDKYPENTIQSFKGALKYGAAGVEFDLWYTKSGDLLIFHDTTLKRMCGKNKSILDITATSRKKYPVYAYGKKSKIPTLEETLRYLKKKNAVAFIHLKSDIGPKFGGTSADKVAKCIQKTGMTGKSVVFCGTWSTLNYFHRNHPGVTLGYLTHNTSEEAVKAEINRSRRCGISYFYIINPKDVNYALVNYAHKCGLKIGTYKTRTKKEILNLLDYGADFCMLYRWKISK